MNNYPVYEAFRKAVHDDFARDVRKWKWMTDQEMEQYLAENEDLIKGAYGDCVYGCEHFGDTLPTFMIGGVSACVDTLEKCM